MARCVYKLHLALGVAAPEDEDNVVFGFTDLANDSICEFFLSTLLVGKDGLEAALYGGHGGLEFVGGVFGELALEDVLLLFGVMQLYVELGDAVCYLTELVVGELGKVGFVEG